MAYTWGAPAPAAVSTPFPEVPALPPPWPTRVWWWWLDRRYRRSRKDLRMACHAFIDPTTDTVIGASHDHPPGQACAVALRATEPDLGATVVVVPPRHATFPPKHDRAQAR